MPLRVPCLGPVLHLFSSGGAGPVPLSPCLAQGPAPPCGQAFLCELASCAVGAARGLPGGAFLACVCGARGCALPHALPSVLGACGRGPLPTGCGSGGCGRRDPSQPHSARSCELALRAVGTARGCPGPGRLLLVCGASGVERSPTPDRPSLGRAAGVRYPLAVGAGGVGVGTRHLPQSACCPELALRAVVAARGRRGGGGAWCLCVGRPGLGALPRPTARPRGVRPGPTSHWLWVQGVRARGPVTNPTARALASWLCALWGRHQGAPRGRLVPACGHPGFGALPCPTARPSGVRPGPTTHWLRMRGVSSWGPATNTTARAVASLLCALRGRHGGLRGGATCLSVGRPGLGALPDPTARPWGVQRGPTTHWLWVRGVRAWGPVTNPTARALASWLCAL